MIGCSKEEHRLYSLIGAYCSCINVGLPKWPGMVVVGDRVTPEQAAEIIIRTDSWYFGCNDRAWEDDINKALGVPVDQSRFADWESMELLRQEHRVLDLEYLTTACVASAYIGGAQGWCSWDGQIHSVGHNIGKWPSCESVAEEWVAIATAFPFLNLKCQLYNGESCEEETVPVIEYTIANGQVTYSTESLQPIAYVARESEDDIVRTFMTRSERGCTIDQFKWALEKAKGLPDV